MMRLLLFSAVVGLAFGLSAWDEGSSESVERAPIRLDLHFGDPELEDYINSVDTTWKAGPSPKFSAMRRELIPGLMGVRSLVGDARRPHTPLSKTRFLHLDIPDQFDSGEHWPQCSSIRLIRDQSACGSCWAFGAVEAMSDRVCIGSGGRDQVTLSADDLLSCCSRCGFGCEGGEPMEAWHYWVANGIVSGSNFTAGAGCRPYPFPPCEHHNNATRFKPCNHDLYHTPKCVQKCVKPGMTYEAQKFYGSKAYAIDSSVEAIQKEIMTHGPVEAAFTVYEDLLLYKSGVYQHTAGTPEGGHAIRIVGWGVEGGVPFWRIANSWNTDWGDAGYFKILRGKNECGIEDGVVAGLAKVNHSTKKSHRGHHHRSHRRDAEPL